MIAHDVSNRVDVVKWKNDVSEAVPLDLDALRLVVEAALKYANQHEPDFSLDNAIAKIEKLLK